MNTTTTETTIDLQPLLALRPECLEMADRLASDTPPPISEWEALEGKVHQARTEFAAAITAHVVETDPFFDRSDLIDAISEVVHVLTAINTPGAVADEVYSDIYADRSMLHLLRVMQERGAVADELREAYNRCSDDGLTDEGHEAALAFIAGQS